MTSAVHISGQAMPITRKGTVQEVSFTGSVAETPNPVNDRIKGVMLTADQDCYINYGKSPLTIDATNRIPLWAGAYLFFQVDPGDKIAVTQVTTAGTLTVMELG